MTNNKKGYEVPVIIDDTELGVFEGTTAEFEELVRGHDEDEKIQDEPSE